MMSDSQSSEDVIEADPRFRRLLVFCLIAGTAIGAGVVILLDQHLKEVMKEADVNPEGAFRQVFDLLRWTSMIVGAGFLMIGLYLGRFFLRVTQQDRFPPEGTRVLRDTPILRGAGAMRKGRLGLLFAVVLLLLGLSVPWIPDLMIRPAFQSIRPVPNFDSDPGESKPDP